MKIFKSACLIICFWILILNFTTQRIQAEENIYHNNPEKVKKIALTFDDGPHPRYTKQILEILSEYNVTATFFIIGVNAINYPDTLLAVKDSGCEIANHTFSHKSVSSMSVAEIDTEIKDCQSTVYQITGKTTSLFRPPEGACVEQVKEAADELDYKIILWSIDTKDWVQYPYLLQNQVQITVIAL